MNLDLATIINCPMCAAVVVLLGVFAPKLLPVLSPLLSRILGRKPADPNSPTPVTPSTPRPLLDLLGLLRDMAKRKFPQMPEEQAVERFLVQERFYQFIDQENKEKESAAK